MSFRALNRRLSTKVVALVILLGLVSIIVVNPVFGRQEAGAVPYTIGLHSAVKIHELIYPTFGNPAIIKKGTTLDIEYDDRNRDFYAMPKIVDQVEVQASLPKKPGASNADGTFASTDPAWQRTWNLPYASSLTWDFSSHWPSYPYDVDPMIDKGIWKWKVTVPSDIPTHLYDLKVRVHEEGGAWSAWDSQPHALQVVDDYKADFDFMQLSDVHVFGPECTYPSGNQKERSSRTVNYSDANGYGALYFHKEIMEINRTKPDFVVLTGDYDFGQYYWHQSNGAPWGDSMEWEYEQLWFYQELMALEVPVYVVLGNHDGYYYTTTPDYGTGGPINQDCQTNATYMYGPLYYPFDYGNYHFVGINSLDLSTNMRALALFDLIVIQIMQPIKYMGSGRSGGDTYAAGWSDTRFNNILYGNFTGQLKWLHDDLAANQGKTMRIAALHHDPYKDGSSETSGSMWTSEGIEGILDMGRGDGRLAFIKLFRDFKVAGVISGHDHSDYYGSMSWLAGGGETKFINSTSASFQADGNSSAFPGFKWIFISGSNIAACGYPGTAGAGPGTVNYSYPFYKDTNVGSTTNLHNLSTPAVQTTWTGTPGTSTDVTCNIKNWWTSISGAPLNDPYVEFPMPYLSGHHYYALTGGGGYEGKPVRESFWENSDSTPTYRVYNVTGNDIAAGGQNDVRMVDAGVDSSLPTGTLNINGGEDFTQSLDVTLNITGTDTPSGIRDMKVSNDPSFTGASWEKVPWGEGQSSGDKTWTLAAGGYGDRTVYLKFRDMAMPANESATIQHTIEYGEPVPTITGLSAAAGYVGTTITISGHTFGATRGSSTVTFGAFTPAVGDYVSWSDTSIQVKVPASAYGGPLDVVVHVAGQPDSNALPFSVTPYINTYSPTTGPPGTTVTLTGTGYGPTRGTSYVKFGETQVQSIDYLSWSGTQIQVKVPPGVATGAVSLKVRVGSRDSNGKTFTVPTPPAITGISAHDGYPGDTVTITGTDFGSTRGTSYIKFGTFDPASGDYVSWSDTSIQVKVPAAAYYGPQAVYVHAAGGDSNSETFNVKPKINSLNPTHGESSWEVTISGSGFGPSQSDSKVFFGTDEPMAYNSWTNTQIVVTIPAVTPGATQVKVNTIGGDSNLADFTVDPTSTTPHINDVSTSAAYTGTTVTISGMNFGVTQGSSYVRFGSFAPSAGDYVSWAATQIKVKVPASAYGTMNISVTKVDPPNPNLTGSWGTFYVAPYISSVNPTYGNAGVTYVTLTGTGFTPTRGTLNSVWFGSSKATTYSSWSNTSIRVQVGAGAQGQAKIKVLANSCYSNAKAFDVRPVINSITPTTGPGGTQITISGSAFCNVQGVGLVCFGSTNVATVVSWKQTQIKVKVPSSVPAGAVQVKIYTLGGMSNYKVFTKT